MNTSRIIFMGTPEYAVPYLEGLISAGFNPCTVISQPDRPSGRKQTIEPTPIKKCALAHGIPVLQPEHIRDTQWTNAIRDLSSDMIIVVAFGQIIPKSILDIPHKGCINIHPSLLPKYRGASPLQTALLNGDSETGVTIMHLDEKMDHGPIIAQEKIQLEMRETIISLRKKTTEVGIQLLIDSLSKIESNAVKYTEQDHAQATYTKLLNLDDGSIDFSAESAEIIDRKIRALNPEPGTWTVIQGKRLKILEALLVLGDKNDELLPPTTFFTKSENGKKYLYARCTPGILQLDTVQLEGKKSMSGAEFANGHRSLL
ncbi:MAG: methionyl-tRNA formyltransferase [Patescibacteria group bacterium]